jgi:hypothetical protein
MDHDKYHALSCGHYPPGFVGMKQEDFDEQQRDIRELEAEVQRLQCALSFWHPGVPANGPESVYERAAHDAFLLCGYDGPVEPGACELGWITLNTQSVKQAVKE